MRRSLLASAFVLAVACSRDLEVPSQNRLEISPAFTTVAPRDPVAFTARGGAGGYRFEFSQGGLLSGEDASVGATSGRYQAGSVGSAQDIVRVVDAAGAFAEARVTVTAHLAALPGEAYLSPGGTLTPALSGGRLPYGFALVRAPGSTAALVAGTYVAGPEGDVVDEIAVNDGTLDPAASTTITVHVGPRVRVYPPSAAVAPGEALSFVALGGAAPHTVALENPSGGTISPTGAYLAGPVGGVVDRVTITDGNGQLAVADVTVGPALGLTVAAGEIRPGVTTPLVATGGKPPYAFAFAPRGNRSLGTVAAQTGDYVPGRNVGARDRVMVTDAVGATAYRDVAAVRGLQVHPGPGAVRCIAADLNGDDRGDVIIVAEDGGQNFLAARSLSLPAGGGALELPVNLPAARVHDQVLVADFNGTGRDQLVFFGVNGLWSLVPDAAGGLVFGPSLPGSRFFPPTVVGADIGWPAALVRGPDVNRIVTGAPCGGGTGLWRVDWPVGASSPDANPACEPVTLGTADGTRVFAMAAGDLDGDGRPDLAWVEAAGMNVSFGPVKVALGLPAGGFAAPLEYPFPVAGEGMADRWWWGTPETGFLMTPVGLFLVLVPPGGVPAHVELLKAGAGAPPGWAAGFPVETPQIGGPFGVAARDGSGTRLATWTVDGRLAMVDLDPAGLPTVHAAPVATPKLCMAFTDLNGDGIPDLVAGDVNERTSDVLFGDGGTSYGARAWFARTGALAPLGDVSGDGLGDLVVASGDRSVRVLFGGSGQLAYGSEIPLADPVVALAAGVLGGPAPSAILLDQAGALRELRLNADGTAASQSRLATIGVTLMTHFRVLLHDLGGTAPGDDVIVVMGQGDRTSGESYFGTAVIRDAGGATRYAQADLLWSERWCEMLAAGTDEVVALCVGWDQRTQHLLRARLSTGSGGAAPWNPEAVPSLAGAGTVGGSVAAAGTLPTGEAVFVSSPGVAAGPAAVYAVTVAPHAGVTITRLDGIAGPVTGAALGPLRAGQADLVVMAGGTAFTFLAQGAGVYAAGSAIATPGTPAAILPLRTATTADALFATPDALVPLLGDGAGGLR